MTSVSGSRLLAVPAFSYRRRPMQQGRCNEVGIVTSLLGISLVLAACSEDTGRTLLSPDPPVMSREVSVFSDCRFDLAVCDMIYQAIYHLNESSDEMCRLLAGRAHWRFFDNTGGPGFRPMLPQYKLQNRWGGVLYSERTGQPFEDYLGVTFLDWDEIDRLEMDNVSDLSRVVAHEEVHQMGVRGRDPLWSENWADLPCVIDTHS